MNHNEIWDGEEFSSLVIIPADLDGARLDAALAKCTDQSRSAIERLLEGGQIFREDPSGNGKIPTKKDKVKAGERYTVLVPPPEDYDAEPEEMRARLGEDVHLDFDYQYDSKNVVGSWGFWDGWQAVCVEFAERYRRDQMDQCGARLVCWRFQYQIETKETQDEGSSGRKSG